MSRRDDDAAEALLQRPRHPPVTLTGAEAWTLAHDIATAAKALGRVNTKGLPVAHRREIEAARHGMAASGRMLTAKAEAGRAADATAATHTEHAGQRAT